MFDENFSKVILIEEIFIGQRIRDLKVYDNIFDGLPKEFFANSTNQLFTDCMRSEEFTMNSLYDSLND